ncbi:MAG TPA: FAD-dependent oxidoreductase [Candidatus Bathyarchaeia archaeon]|nr:FAD-dependent oxidoreductase [Candidatus Bathyarchaeia archaeon]
MKFETKILGIIPRTADVTSYRFPRPPELNYKPGQFFFVALKQGDKELNKHFSFSSSPTDTGFIEFTKRFTDHEYSMALKAAKVGDWTRIDAPYGAFTFEGEFPKIALLAGGIGVTPFMSICKNATDKQLQSEITLFLGCRTPNDIPFRQELEAMQQANKNLKLHFVVNQPTPDWKGATGIITADMIQKELPDYKDNIFYCCGPPGMVTAMEKMIDSIGLPKTQLKLEYFTGY